MSGPVRALLGINKEVFPKLAAKFSNIYGALFLWNSGFIRLIRVVTNLK